MAGGELAVLKLSSRRPRRSVQEGAAGPGGSSPDWRSDCPGGGVVELQRCRPAHPSTATSSSVALGPGGERIQLG